MDKNPAYRDPGETWGKNKITMLQWDYLEKGTAVLSPAAVLAADASQLLEGDKYPTASLVVPMTYALMKTSSISEDVKFRNRAADEFNDPSGNPVKVPHSGLSPKIQDARAAYHDDKFPFTRMCLEMCDNSGSRSA